ncbi:MAG: gliding motility-associated C-terminal domain-containing protein [Bacteroidota bacterium]
MFFFLGLLGCFLNAFTTTPRMPVNECGLLPNMDTLILQTNCDQDAVVCTGVNFGEEWRYRFRQNGAIIEPNVACNLDTIGFYSPINEEVFSSTFAPFFVENWQVDDRSFSGEFLSIAALVDSLNRWDALGNWQFDANQDRIMGGIGSQTYGSLTIEILITNTKIVSEYNEQIIANNIGIPLTAGDHMLEITDLANRCTDDIVVRVLCASVDTLQVNLSIGDRRTVCIENRELIGSANELFSSDPNPRIFSWRSTTDNCIELRGNLSGQTSVYMINCDEFGACDSTLLNIRVGTALDRQVHRAVRVGTGGSFCVETERLLPGQLTRFENTCPNNMATVADFRLDAERLCVEYEGLAVGEDEACLKMCDSFGNCDSLNLTLTVVTPDFVSDTVFLNVDTVTYCFDTEDFGDFLRIEQRCENIDSTDKVDFELDPKNYCITYTGQAIGSDSTCVWLIDEDGNASLTVLYINVTQAQPSTVSDSLFINQTIEICVDTTDLPGNINNFYNSCPLVSGDKTDIFVTSDRCVEVTGMEIGLESACLVLCDDLGFCDTTYLNIAVVPYENPPIVRDDTSSTSQANSVVIPVQNNDDLTGGVSVISIGETPQFGQAVINPDGTITYFPNKQNCEGEDQFTYLICNDGGCSSATVFVKIICDELIIYTGMSPNGDGVNETFFIANIEAQPNNHLEIFNRWGHKVYEADSYQNDWDGTWRGKLLPDGTYFYILEVESETGKLTYRGSVELHR